TGTAGRATGATWGTTATAPPDQAGTTAPPDQTGATAPPDQAGVTTGPGGQPTGLPLPRAEQPGDPPFFDVLTPDPLQATNDVPGLYESGCQIDAQATTSEPCEWGDSEGEIVVAAVGDSKMAQWVPALDRIGADNGWLVRTYTKQGCAFTDSMLVTAEGEPYTTCRDWGRDVLDGLTGAEKPDVVLVSSVMSKGLPVDHAPHSQESQDAFNEGYV